MSLQLGVVGNPIAHSKSPAIFRNLFRIYGVEGSYCWLSVQPGYPLRNLMVELGLDGINITSPFKEIYSAEVDTLTDQAKRLGCINAVRREGSRFIGHNTDPEGVTHMLQLCEGRVATRHALVLGAGGAARAAVAGLMDMGYAITIMNRNSDRAKAFSSYFNIPFVEWGKWKNVSQDGMLFSCLPPNATIPSIDWHLFSLVMDATYAHSPIQIHCEGHGIPYIDGYSWLLGQAVSSFSFLTGRDGPSPSMEALPPIEYTMPTHYAIRHLPESMLGKDRHALMVCVGENATTELDMLRYEAYWLGKSAR